MNENSLDFKVLLKEFKSDFELLINDSINNDFENLKPKLRKLLQILKEEKNEENETELNIFLNSITYKTPSRVIEFKEPITTDGFILDIGGGGEGVIGALNGKKVIAIDINEKELLETQNDSLKVIMDATDIKFVANSFDVCTCFFSLMYIPKNYHEKVLKEIYRVLNKKGKLLI